MATAVASRIVVSGPLAPFAGGFLGELERCHYTSRSRYAQMLVLARLSRWLGLEGLGGSDLTPAVLGRFIAELGEAGYRNPRSLRGFGTVLGYLRGVGAVPVPAPPPVPGFATPEEEVLDRYQQYLASERGVCEQVACAYIRQVRRFLGWRAAGDGGALEGLTAAEVSAFVLAECAGGSTRRGSDLTVALRSFLIFLHVEGVLAESLTSAVPRIAGWRLAGCRARWSRAWRNSSWLVAIGAQ